MGIPAIIYRLVEVAPTAESPSATAASAVPRTTRLSEGPTGPASARAGHGHPSASPQVSLTTWSWRPTLTTSGVGARCVRIVPLESPALRVRVTAWSAWTWCNRARGILGPSMVGSHRRPIRSVARLKKVRLIHVGLGGTFGHLIGLYQCMMQLSVVMSLGYDGGWS
jgi:hypothetical protein